MKADMLSPADFLHISVILGVAAIARLLGASSQHAALAGLLGASSQHAALCAAGAAIAAETLRIAIHAIRANH